MLRTGKWIPIVCCLAMLGLAACSGGDKAVCGNGKAEKGEQCDLMDLDGKTCHDVLPGSTGNLACSLECSFDTANCSNCGDGVTQVNEACDCGDDPANLPTGCIGVNGAAGANCSATCTRVAVCGDGRVDAPETCDCGDDPANLPTGCTGVNGAVGSGCNASCRIIAECREDEPWEECSITAVNDCCPDQWGVDMDCFDSAFGDMDYMCNRDCDTAADCWFNTACVPTYKCLIAFCDIVGASFWGACSPLGAGATQGLCMPFGRFSDTRDPFGLCFEKGNIPHGSSCPMSAGLFDTDRDANDGAEAVMCDTGLCYGATGAEEGTCYQFCDWEKTYANAIYNQGVTNPLACPTGSNCFPESTIDETSGYRSGDYAACRPNTAADDLVACSLVTGQLISNTAQTCADVETNGHCVLVDFGTSGVTWGSLIGACIEGAAPANLAVWAACDPASTTQICPAGTLCEKPDVFDDGSEDERCVPMCDTNNAAGPQAHCTALGAPAPTGDATPTCRSVSYLFGTGGAADTMKTRLGLCGWQVP